MQKTRQSPPAWHDGIALVRVAFGALLVYHAWQVLLGNTSISLSSLIHNPDIEEVLSMAIPILELVGGSLLVVGLFTRTTTFLLSLALGLVTFMATREVPLENGLVPFLMGMISMTFLFVGAGRLSLDYLIYLNRRAHHEREELNRFGRYVSR